MEREQQDLEAEAAEEGAASEGEDTAHGMGGGLAGAGGGYGGEYHEAGALHGIGSGRVGGGAMGGIAGAPAGSAQVSPRSGGRHRAGRVVSHRSACSRYSERATGSMYGGSVISEKDEQARCVDGRNHQLNSATHWRRCW